MKIENASPFSVGLLLTESAVEGPFISVIVKGTFAMRRGDRPAALRKPQRAILAADEPYDPKVPGGTLRFESDRVPYKPRTDVVLVGSAYAPDGRSLKCLDVTIGIGTWRKTLRVFGDRQWSFASEADPSPLIAGPAEFTQMPLRYERAFGGIDARAGMRAHDPTFKPWCERNPLGRGFCGARTVASIHGRFLPNIEDPDEPIVAWNSAPRPACCAFFPRVAQPRATFFGTFDELWRATRAPARPVDFRFDCYNGADPSFQISPYLVGNENVQLTNVTPRGGRFDLTLPCLIPLVAVVGERGFEERAVQLDTLVFVPDESIFYQVWRCLVPVTRPDASDIREVRVDCEVLPASDQRREN